MKDRFKFRFWDKFNSVMTYSDDVNDGELSSFFALLWKAQSSGNGTCIMQSTGLRDMNDKLIYEGDILTDGKNGRAFVGYCQKVAQFLVFKLNGDCWYLNEGDRSRGTKLLYTRICGNIEQNNDLLQ
jgi:hypothetical protein